MQETEKRKEEEEEGGMNMWDADWENEGRRKEERTVLGEKDGRGRRLGGW